MNPYVFIVGCPRSGTTLLRRLVDAHPHIAIIHQSRFIPNFFERRRGLTSEGLVTTKLVDRLLEARGVKNLETNRELLKSLVEAEEPLSSISTGRGTASASWGTRLPLMCAASPPCTPCGPRRSSFTLSATDATYVCRP